MAASPTIIFKLILVCADPEIVNHTKIWTPQDELAFGKAVIECQMQEQTPCLGLFTKKEDGTHESLCIQKSLFKYGSEELPPGFKN